MQLKCKFVNCNFTHYDVNKLINHTFQFHSHYNIRFECCHLNCAKKFKHFRFFNNHVTKKHDLIPKELVKFKCNFGECGVIVDSLDLLYSHSYEHVRKNEIISCFYKNCDYNGTNYKNFKSHLSDRHKNFKSAEHIKRTNVIFNDDDDDTEFEQNYGQEFESTDYLSTSVVEEEENLLYKMTKNLDDLSQIYMMIYLKLKDKYLIAEYKCDEIFEDINQLVKFNNNHMKSLIKHTNKLYNNYEQTVQTLNSHLNQSLFEEVHKKKRLESNKSKWLSNTNFYVEPKEIEIDEKN